MDKDGRGRCADAQLSERTTALQNWPGDKLGQGTIMVPAPDFVKTSSSIWCGSIALRMCT